MENLFEWWQLFDPITCRYYYYNINNQRTAWHLPSSSSSANQNDDKSSSMSSLCAANTTSKTTPSTIKSHPLASRLVSLLIKNHSLLNNTSTNDLKILNDNLRREGFSGGREVDLSDEKFLKLFLNKNLTMIQSTLMTNTNENEGENEQKLSISTIDGPPPSLTQSLIKTKPTTNNNTTSIVSVPLNAAMSSLTNLSPNSTSKCNNSTSVQQQPHSQPATMTTQRRLLPRTNPNYVNVDLIDSNNGKTTIKNTYVKLQDLNGRSGNGGIHGGLGGGNEKENNNSNNDGHVIMTNSLKRPTTISNEEKMINKEKSDLYQQATLLLLSILKNTEKGERELYYFLSVYMSCKKSRLIKKTTTTI